MKKNTFGLLVQFSQVAKYNSLSSAGKSLFLTTGALSQQLIVLEEQLGFALFFRHSRGITPTEEGKKIFDCVEQCSETIQLHIDEIKSKNSIKNIRLKLTPSFALKWLVPRLQDFYLMYPDIQVQTFAEKALVNSDELDFDLAIDYQPLNKYPEKSIQLAEEHLVPVASPKYLEQHKLSLDGNKPSEWKDVIFLHDEEPWSGAKRNYEWEQWASEHQLEVNTDRGHFFNRADMAMSAAEAGIGVAMAREYLIRDEIQSGKLIAPFPPIKAQAAYFLIVNNRNTTTEKFITWLTEQLKSKTMA